MITKKEVQHIAKLARLGLTSKEIEKMRKELSSILDYIDQLKKVEIFKVEPASHSISVENVTREDKVQSEKLGARKKLLEAVPEKKKGFVKVKSIF